MTFVQFEKNENGDDVFAIFRINRTEHRKIVQAYDKDYDEFKCITKDNYKRVKENNFKGENV